MAQERGDGDGGLGVPRAAGLPLPPVPLPRRQRGAARRLHPGPRLGAGARYPRTTLPNLFVIREHSFSF
jgi:hypothetical protein